MSRADYRGGLAPIRTAQELAQVLPIPLYLMVSGYAGPSYPLTDRSNPSVMVGIVGLKTAPPTLQGLMGRYLPLWIHWTQWRDVVAPLVLDPRITDWKGVLRDLGDLLQLPVNVIGPDGQVVYEAGEAVGGLAYSTRIPGGLFASEAGELVHQYAGLISQQASSAGF